MDWKEAKENTVAYWKGLRESLDDLDEVELLREINAVNDLCEKAKDESHGDLHRCDYCIALQQFGGCMGISLQMSEAVVDHDHERLEDLVDRFVARLEALELPESRDDSPWNGLEVPPSRGAA